MSYLLSDQVYNHNKELKEQRDDLLKACEETLVALEAYELDGPDVPWFKKKLKAAIKKARRG